MIKVAPYWNGFGDLWALTSYCCLLSQRAGQPVYLSTWSTKSMLNREKEIKDILRSLDDRYTQHVVVTSERFTLSARFSVRDHHDLYVPTKVRWTRNDRRLISYQLETSTRHRPDRFCEPGLIEDLSDQLPDYEFIELGKTQQRTLHEIIAILSQSEFFVGIDSGMSHVAHSVGVPVFLKAYAELPLCHPNKAYVAFRDGQDLKRKLAELPSLSELMRAQAGQQLTPGQGSSLSRLVRRVRRRLIRGAWPSKL
jgi:hypothetical protein